HLGGIVECRNKPAITFGSNHCKVIGHNAPTSRLRAHVKVPVTPTQLAHDEKGDSPAGRHKRQTHCSQIFSKPFAWLQQFPPSRLESRAHQRKRSAHNSDNSRRGHNYPVHSRQYFRCATLPAAPIDEAEQCHKKKRFRVGGDEEKCCRIPKDEKRPANLKRRRK